MSGALEQRPSYFHPDVAKGHTAYEGNPAWSQRSIVEEREAASMRGNAGVSQRDRASCVAWPCASVQPLLDFIRCEPTACPLQRVVLCLIPRQSRPVVLVRTTGGIHEELKELRGIG